MLLYSKQDNKLRRLFTTKWSLFGDNLVKKELAGIIQKEGDELEEIVVRSKSRFKRRFVKFDIIAVGEKVYVFKLKTMLRPKNVRSLVNNLKDFKQIFEKYKDKEIVGGVAFSEEESDAAELAKNMGLLVVRASRNGASLEFPKYELNVY